MKSLVTICYVGAECVQLCAGCDKAVRLRMVKSVRTLSDQVQFRTLMQNRFLVLLVEVVVKVVVMMVEDVEVQAVMMVEEVEKVVEEMEVVVKVVSLSLN